MSVRLRLSTINGLLLALIIAVNLYIVLSPVMPAISFWWQSKHGQRQLQLERSLTASSGPQSSSGNGQKSSRPNSLIIPELLLDQTVIEGPKQESFSLLKQGIWHWPDSSTPDKGGNTVLLAHRFSYTGPHGAFYFLNRLKPGDDIGLVWQNVTYRYRVISSREVPPTETSIVEQTSDARLTLYTCTPLWHPVNRLVVVAEKEKI